MKKKRLIRIIVLLIIVLFWVALYKCAFAANRNQITELNTSKTEARTTITIICLDGIKWVLVERTWGAGSMEFRPMPAGQGAFFKCRN